METIVLRIRRVSPLQTWATLVFLLLNLLNPLSAALMERSTSGLNPIQRENLLPGTTDWQFSQPAPEDKKTMDYPAIEGYAWTTSALAGDEIKFSVSTTSPFFSADIFRMGWYQGEGGRIIQSIPKVQGRTYSVPPLDTRSGLIEADWPVAFSLKTDAHWVSGIYMVKLTASNGDQSYIPFVLRSSEPSTFAFIHAVNTDEAYNSWGASHSIVT